MSHSFFPKSQFPVILTGSVTALDNLTNQITDANKDLGVGALAGHTMVLRKGDLDYVRTIETCNGDSITLSQGLYDGTQAELVYGDAEAAQITIVADDVGTDQNAWVMNVQNALLNSVPTSATFEDGVLDVIVGTGADGLAATVDIGSGVDGTVTVTYFEEGEIGNEYSIEGVLGSEPSQPLSVEFNSPVITVTLATTEESVPDVTETTATASGTGETPVPVQVETPLAGGTNPTITGTATTVAEAIDLIEGLSATMTGAGGVLDETTAPVAFAGGTDAIFPAIGDDYIILSKPAQQDVTFFERFTGAVDLDEDFTVNQKWQIEEIRIHLSAAGGAGDLTITSLSSVDTVYNTLLLTQDMTAITNLVWRPNYPMKFDAGDGVTIAWANEDTKTYGIEIVYSVI